MLSNMASSLITHKRITTTVAKAKALRKFVEPVVTRSKTDTTHNRREAFKSLRDKNAVAELFGVVGPKVADRPGGYVRIIKLGTRLGDSAEMAMIELVDFNETMLQAKKPKTRRSRRGGGKKSSDTTTAQAPGEATAQEAEAAKAEKLAEKTESKDTSEAKTEEDKSEGRGKSTPEPDPSPDQAKAAEDEAAKRAGQKAHETEADEAARLAKAREAKNKGMEKPGADSDKNE